MERLKSIILAAGEGTRMKSNLPKVLHKILGKSMVEHVICASKEAGAQEICVVIGHKGESVKNAIGDFVTYALQAEQLGTGHAVMQADAFIEEEGDVLILFGDTPLITGKTLSSLIGFHRQEKNAVTVLSAIVEDPTGYGRIIRDQSGTFMKSVEHKDASGEERSVREINSGMYCFRARELKQALKEITNHNAQGEYYLPDALAIIKEKGMRVGALAAEVHEDILGVNSRIQLAQAADIMRRRVNEKHMAEGVTIVDPAQTYIHEEVQIGRDTIIYPGTILEGHTVIGENCILGPNTRIVDGKLMDGVEIQYSVVLESEVGEGTTVGPYAYIRPHCTIGKHVKIGDFVEIKNAVIGDYTKASHLTYIGDADVGQSINFGCGTVVVNYDGQKKHRTVIEDQAFIGCNTNLVAPVTVKKGGYIAAGSTITDNVPENALAIARARQVNKTDWKNTK